MREKGVLQATPTQNIQMMPSEPGKEDPSINMVLRSDATIEGNMWQKHAEDGKSRNAPTKEPNSETEQVMKTSGEAQRSVVEASTPSTRDQTESRLDPSMITTILETCMKLLCDSKPIKGL